MEADSSAVFTYPASSDRSVRLEARKSCWTKKLLLDAVQFCGVSVVGRTATELNLNLNLTGAV